MMISVRPWIVRLLGCWAALLVSALLFHSMGLLEAAWGGILLTLFYTFLRPLLQAVLLPFNLLLAGVLTPLTDAWLVLWAAAWSGGRLGYWQAVFTAVLILLFYLPYSRAKKERLLGGRTEI